MKLSSGKLKKICKNNQITISELLQQSGVSKNAFYSLLRKENILPNSITKIARQLHIKPSDILEEVEDTNQKIAPLILLLNQIMRIYSNVDRDNIWHTLVLLEEEPLKRLQRALRRGQKFNLYR